MLDAEQSMRNVFGHDLGNGIDVSGILSLAAIS